MLGAVLCADAQLHCILPVGSHPAGNARWGHADMAGNVFEWTLDYLSMVLPQPCVDCAQLQPTVLPRPAGPPITPTTFQLGRVERGGDFGRDNPNFDHCTTTFRDNGTTYSGANGFRCARDHVMEP